MFTIDTTDRKDIFFVLKVSRSFSINADYSHFAFFDYDVYGNQKATI